MDNYEIQKLRKEVQRKNDAIKEQREDRQFIEKELVQIRAERDKYHGQLLIARQTMENVDQIMAGNVKEMKLKLEHENSESLNELQSIKDRLMEEKNLNEKLIQENRNKDTVISELSLRLREMSRKYKDSSLLVNTKQITEQAMITHTQYYKLTEKYNKLCEDMENIMAENKILRKIHGVPENFGFDFEQIKIAEKQELQDYKAQCRKLQTQIQELEAQRTQLRYRLRQYNTLYSNKGERYKDMTQRQFEYLDAYALKLKEGKIEEPIIDKSQKEMEKEILKLRAQVQALQARGPMSIMPKQQVGGNLPQSGERLSPETMKRLQDQIKSTLEPFVQDIKKLSETNLNGLISNLQNIQASQGQISPEMIKASNIPANNFQPPIPLPLAHNDWSKIKEGYSYTYSSKLPVEMKDLDDDVGFDVFKARYMVAALQLQNIQSLKMLKEKQRNEDLLSAEFNDLKQKYRKCLQIQDDLFVRYFKEKEQVRESIKQLEIDKNVLTSERDSLRIELDTLKGGFHALSTKTNIQKQLKTNNERLAKVEAQLLREEKKYDIIKEEHKTLRTAYTRLESKASQNQYNLRQKLLTARKNEKQLTLLMNQVLSETKGSISSDVHNILLAKMQTLNVKSSNHIFKQAQLRVKISRLESIERQMNIKDEMIEHLRQDNLDLSLQLQIVKNRLQAVDPVYQNYRATFDRLVSFINENSVSLVTYFKKFDRDGSGKLSKNEFLSSLSALGFKINAEQMENLFSEFDLDGSGSITYTEFIRKLRRGGANTRSKEQQAIFQFFKAIKQANISIKKAFQIIDMDGSNSITKSEMETAFRKIGIDCDSYTVDSIFKISDGDLDGKITCTEMQKLFEDIVRQSAIEETELKTQLDWKYAFVLKIEQCAVKNNESLRETFKALDDDGSSFITMSQLSSFFTKSGIYLERKSMDELFKFLDSRFDGKIEFGEFLQKLEEAKRERKRVDRLKFVQKRAQELKRQNALLQPQKKTKIGEQEGLKVRLMGLQTKQGHLINKNEKLCKTLAKKEQQIFDLERTTDENERSLIKAQDEFFKVKEDNIILQEKLKSSLSEVESIKLKQQINKIKVQNAKIFPELGIYKGLHEALSDKNRSHELMLGKVEVERDKYYDKVKELQGKNQVETNIAKITTQLEYSKRNEEIINKKYDDVIEQLRKITLENNNLSLDSIEKEKQIINTHVIMRESMNLQQAKIDNLSAKILPTISSAKIDEFIIKLREISNSKSQLEEQNQALREKNFNLQLRNDYIENEKIHIEELERRLRRNYTDQNSVAIIDLTKKLSDYKMGELKAKREVNLLKEKQDYYMRVNNSNTDSIKELEQQLGKWEIKFNEREQFWRKRLSDQMKVMEDIQKEVVVAKKAQKQAVLYFQKEGEEEKVKGQMIDTMDQGRRNDIRSFIVPPKGGIDSQTVFELKEKVQGLQRELIEKEKEIYKLRTTLQEIVPNQKMRFSQFGSQIGGAPTNSLIMQTDLSSSQLKNNARRFLNNQRQQEDFYKSQAERMAQAAQQSIDTLQRIIDDKNDQLKRKQRIIDELKQEMLKNKEEDCYEIQKLNEEIRDLRSKKELASINDIMKRPTQKNFYSASSDEKMKLLMQAVDNKDSEIKNLQNKYDQLFLNKNKSSVNTGQKLIESKLRELQQEREQEKKKHSDNQLRLKEKIKNLEKLSKEKDTKLTQLNRALIQIKEDVVNEKKSLDQQEIEGNEEYIMRMNKGNNSNDSRMEVMLQKAMQTIQGLTKKNKQYEGELKKLKEENRLNKTLHRK